MAKAVCVKCGVKTVSFRGSETCDDCHVYPVEWKNEPMIESPSWKGPASKANPLSLKGVNGQIVFDGQTVVISRKGIMGFMTQGLKGSKEIPVSKISAIQLKLGGALVNGYIQLATGAGESKGGINAAVSDENSVVFTFMQNEEFETLKLEISKAMEGKESKTAGSVSVAEQLEKLAGLLDRGLLSDKEFLAEKKKLLGS